MSMLGTRVMYWPLLAVMLVVAVPGVRPPPAAAVEVGQPAPDFSLPATTGVNISLGQFRGKKLVLLEFYGADFRPT